MHTFRFVSCEIRIFNLATAMVEFYGVTFCVNSAQSNVSGERIFMLLGLACCVVVFLDKVT